MPHSRFDWASRIKAAEREYQAVRVAVDWMLGATPDEIHDVTEERGWDDLAVADIYAASPLGRSTVPRCTRRLQVGRPLAPGACQGVSC